MESSTTEISSGCLLSYECCGRKKIFLQGAAAGGLRFASQPCCRPCFPAESSGLHSFAPTHVHQISSPTPAAEVELASRRWCGPVGAEAPEQRRCTGGSRPVYGCSGFVTGALAAVKRVKAAKGAVERPFRDTKRAAAT